MFCHILLSGKINLIFPVRPVNIWKSRFQKHNYSSFVKASQCVKTYSTLFKKKRLLQLTKKIYTKCLEKKSFKFINLSTGSILAAVSICKLKLKYAFCKHDETRHTRLVGINTIEDQEAHFDWKKFFNLVRTEFWYILVAVVSALAVAAMNIEIPVVLGNLVNVISKFMSSSENANNSALFFEEVKNPAIRLVYMYILQSVFTFIYISALSISGERVAHKLRNELFSSVIEQDVAFFDAHKSGEISSRLTNDVQEFKSCYKLVISQGLRSIAQAAGCIVSLYIISPKMTAIMMCVLPTIMLVGTYLGRTLRKWSKSAQSQTARASAVADEAIGNIKTVRAFAMEDKEKELYDRELQKAQHLNSSLGIGIGVFQGLTNLALNGVVLGILYVGGSLMYTEDMTPGDMMSFLVATQTIQKSLAHLSTLFGMYIRGLAAGARIFQYMNLSPVILLTGGKKISNCDLSGEVKFRNVTFSYPTRPDQVVLNNFNLTLPPGKMVALCGLSGGGKSTVANLLERFYDVNDGQITIDGVDLRDLDPSWLRSGVIGYINQEPVLFATSIMENIRYGRPTATDEEVIEAAKLANAHDFISGFTRGYNTLLGERGTTVSGGQKQRIAIARALLKNPKILILDEATSALDAKSEKSVQEALDYASQGRTVLVIAHRLSTIQNADAIAVITKGEVAEIGNHQTLYSKKGLYWNLIRQQKEANNNDNNKNSTLPNTPSKGG